MKNCKKKGKCTGIYDTDIRQSSCIEGGICHTTDTIRRVVVFIYKTQKDTTLWKFCVTVSNSFSHLRSQFHQHYTRAFFVRIFRAKIFVLRFKV
jgi:hypothetical protein